MGTVDSYVTPLVTLSNPFPNGIIAAPGRDPGYQGELLGTSLGGHADPYHTNHSYYLKTIAGEPENSKLAPKKARMAMYPGTGNTYMWTDSYVVNAKTKGLDDAWKLGFRHPRSAKWKIFEAPLPDDFDQAIATVGL